MNLISYWKYRKWWHRVTRHRTYYHSTDGGETWYAFDWRKKKWFKP